MTKVEHVMQDFLDPLASFSCTTPYFLHTSLSVSASSRIETPCWSRKPAWQRQSSGLTPSTTQSWRGKNAFWVGENGGAPGGGFFSPQNKFFPPPPGGALGGRGQTEHPTHP